MPEPTTAPVVRLAELREEPLDVNEVLTAVSDAVAGGVNVFVGVVRDHDHAQSVSALEYSAHPSAAEALREVLEEVACELEVVAVAAVHRTGHLAVGDIAVVTAVSCAHRGEAFTANREVIDRLKQRVPVWKHQLFADGSDEWVGLP